MYGPAGASNLAGSISDTGSNTYTRVAPSQAPYTINSGITYCYADSFYCLNTGSSATSVTYTTNAGYAGNLYTVLPAVWVWTVSGGTAAFGSQSNNGQNAPGTGANAVTSGSVTCATGSVIMGLNLDESGNTVTVGTGFSSDYSSFGIYTAEHGAFSASQGATFTLGTGTDNPLMSQALSFGFSTSGPGTSPRLPLLQLGVVTPLAWIIRRRQIRARELRQWKQDSSSGLILPDYKRVA
jgi:hypothetical protein